MCWEATDRANSLDSPSSKSDCKRPSSESRTKRGRGQRAGEESVVDLLRDVVFDDGVLEGQVKPASARWGQFAFRANRLGTRSRVSKLRFGLRIVSTTRIVRGFSYHYPSSSPDTVSTILKIERNFQRTLRRTCTARRRVASPAPNDRPRFVFRSRLVTRSLAVRFGRSRVRTFSCGPWLSRTLSIVLASYTSLQPLSKTNGIINRDLSLDAPLRLGAIDTLGHGPSVTRIYFAKRKRERESSGRCV